ncbi:MAG: NUDIX hydrolase [Gordonia sp. (in: high G+C Gram-positive bacteria)]
MSAESPVSRTDVANDAPSSGDPQNPRPRRGRRGRRRRGRRGKPAAENPGAAVETASATAERVVVDDAAPACPKPSDLVKKADSAKPSDLVGDRRRRSSNNAGKAPSGKGSPGQAQPTGKPSGKASAKSPAVMPRTKRRAPAGGRHSGDAAVASPRLRTVRETSAGGLVLNNLEGPYDELTAVLIGRIDRRGRMMWSLPKGHIETGETAEQTAIREIAEETGVDGTVVAPLGKIDYWFVSEGRRIHKTVHHYLLRYSGGELSDADYEVSEVAWVPLTELPRRLTYSDERRLARTAEGVIAELRDDPDRLAQSEADSIRTEPNDYEKAAAARNQRRNEPPPAAKPRRRRRRPRRGKGGASSAPTPGDGDAGSDG